MVEDHDKTLYIRLPHTIKNMDEIRDLFVGDVQIKLPRQSCRHCHVIFSTVEEKMKNLKEVKKKLIENKRIIACAPKMKARKNPKNVERKTVVPDPKPESKMTQILYVTNINAKTKLRELKKAFGYCKSATFLDNTKKSVKTAIVRLSDPQLAAEYLKKQRPWPVIDGNKLVIKSDTRKQKKKKPGLKIWDGEVEITDGMNVESDKKQSKKKKVKSDEKKSSGDDESTAASDEDEDEDEDENESENENEDEDESENENIDEDEDE